jgi:signal peptidase I
VAALSGAPILGRYLKTLIPVLVFSLLIKAFIGETFRMPTDFMRPTLERGDLLWVWKAAYSWNDHQLPARGDVIVYTEGDGLEGYYVRRVQGLPGDEVEILTGKILLNGKPLEVKGLDAKNCGIELNRSVCLGLLHFPKARVPEGKVWVVADHRGADSERPLAEWVHISQIIGRASRVLLSTQQKGRTWKKIH